MAENTIFTLDTLPDDIAEQIFDGLYRYINANESNVRGSQVFFWEFHRKDAINSRACGTYSDAAGQPLFDFEIEDGNWNPGFKSITAPGEMSAPARYRTVYYLAPDERKIAAGIPLDHPDYQAEFKRRMKIAEHALASRPDWLKIASDASYDLYVEPTTKTRKHYDRKAAEIGAVLRTRTEAVPHA